MWMTLKNTFFIVIISLIVLPSCSMTKGYSSQRQKRPCCGVLKCDMHRKSNNKGRKRAVNGHKSLRKKEQRIKRGY
jgi:hypothetical protein